MIPLLLCCTTLTGCGGGGGGGAPADSTPPSILAATFIGAGAVPAAGDLLRLTFSEDVDLVPATLLDDEDVTLSGAATLGAVASPPALVSARQVQVSLGAGVGFTPATTTIALSAANDAVRDSVGLLGVGGPPIPITAGDGDDPVIDLLTLDGVDAELNGSGQAGGTLQVPITGFTIDLDFSDRSSSIDATKFVITADRPVNAPVGTLPANTNLVPSLVATTGAASASFFVPADIVFPQGPYAISATVTDTSGRTSANATFSFLTRSIDDAVRPFEAEQLWFLDTSRDVESFGVTVDDPRAPTRITEVPIRPGANGTRDLFDLFLIMGLHWTTPIPDVSGTDDSNQVVTSMFEDEVVDELDQLFPGVDIRFTFTRPGTFPLGRTSVPFSGSGFSQICIAGAAAPTPTGTLGAALFDPHNANHDDDCTLDFQGLRLGVFVHTLTRFGYVFGGRSSTFFMTYAPLTPALNGTAIGDDPDDGDRLIGTNTDGRATTIRNAIERLARAVAVVVAHECGHSTGIVENGPMPQGLYGGDPVNFPLSGGQPPSAADSHIENSSLFPPGSQNVMSPAIEFDASLASDTAFNSLNLAYLLERVFYDR